MGEPQSLKDIMINEAYMIASTILWTFVGLLMMWGGYKFFAWLSPFDDWEEIKNGNVAVAVFFAGVFIGIALIIASVVR